jgi:hypothetical protein
VGLVLPLCRELDPKLSAQMVTGAAKWAPPTLCAESNRSGSRHRWRTGPTSQCLCLHYAVVTHTHTTHATLSTRRTSPSRRAAPARRTSPARRAAPARRTSPACASAPPPPPPAPRRARPALRAAPTPPAPAFPPAVILLGTGGPSSSSAPARHRPAPPVLRPLAAVAVGEAAASSC